MEAKSQTAIMNELFKKFNLIYDPENKKDSDVFISKNFKIITRAGIQKIQAAMDITSKYSVEFIDPYAVVLKGTFSYIEGSRVVETETFGEASVNRNIFMLESRSKTDPDGSISSVDETVMYTQVKGNVMGDPPYLAAMAEKRALSRGVLQLAGLYKLGVFGEDESDDFKKDISRQISE